MQHQYLRFLKDKVNTPAELHRTIRLVVKWGKELLKFDIKPGEIRELKAFYEKIIEPPTRSSPVFTEYLQAKKEEVRLDRLNTETNNTLEQWRYQLDELSVLNLKKQKRIHSTQRLRHFCS